MSDQIDEFEIRARASALENARLRETNAALTACVAELEASTKWTCFHCGETFTDERCAADHFGVDETADAACQIKAGAEGSMLEAIRRAEMDAEKAWCALHNETSDFAKAYRAMTARHVEQLQASEELGFERGVADMRKIHIQQSARIEELEQALKPFAIAMPFLEGVEGVHDPLPVEHPLTPAHFYQAFATIHAALTQGASK